MFSGMTAARASVGGRTEFGSSSRWIDRWLAACRDLAELERSNPMTDAVVEEIDGRMIRIGDQWLADFASCNYLGLDLDRVLLLGGAIVWMGVTIGLAPLRALSEEVARRTAPDP